MIGLCCLICLLILVVVVAYFVYQSTHCNEKYLNLPGEPSPPVGSMNNMVLMGKGWCSGVDGENKIVVSHGRGTVLKDGGYCVSGNWPSLHPDQVTVYSNNPFCMHNLKN